MTLARRSRRLLLAILLYLVFSAVAGVFVADGALHPARRPLIDEDLIAARNVFLKSNAQLTASSITADDGVELRGWIATPQHDSGNAVILLHGMGDNRLGMVGYAELLLAHGYTVLLPDARAHGISGGDLATYGLLERNDIHQWADFLAKEAHVPCVFGLGESMGAAQLLQSLETDPKLCAVAAESPFATFREIAYDRMGQPFHAGPWIGRTFFRPLVEFAFLRARWKYGLDMKRIAPEDSIARSHIPVLLIHGKVDSNIPVRHSQMIHAHDPQTVLWEVPNAGHCGAISVAPAEFDEKILRWFTRKTPDVAKSTP
ncbi:MAG TPA: alpha/beta fold hydrolase [Candidatus Eisenbacteria bacterium]|nr:alpha/beta fold hydrolase [Candidatus Eisenbacteria bacterium]